MVIGTAGMKIGDRVRLIGVPPNLPEGDLGTRAVFQRCLGYEFIIAGFQEDCGWLELRVENVTGNPHETIWVEPEYVELCP